jgi:hypothetical protein
LEECEPCPVFASFTLAFVLQLRRKNGKTSVRVRKTSVKVRKTLIRVKILSQSKIPQSEYIILEVVGTALFVKTWADILSMKLALRLQKCK